MSDNFTFDGKHSLNDMGLYTEIVTRPLFAEPKTVYEDIPGTDGEINFNVSNPKNRMCFKPRIIELECHIVGSNESRSAYTKKILEIASWLAVGENKVLAFDDEPDIHYMAHAANLFNIENITDFSGTFPLVFKCEPFKYDNTECRMASFESYMWIENPGYYVYPKIDVSCTMPNGFTLIHGETDKKLTINTPVDGIVSIDMERMTVEMNGISILHKCEGEFFELPPGGSGITLNEDPEMGASIFVEFCPRYL